MDRKKLTRELDLYIKQNYRPEGFKLKDFIGVGTVGAMIIIKQNKADCQCLFQTALKSRIQYWHLTKSWRRLK